MESKHHRRHWTEKQVERLVRMKLSGKSVWYMARKLRRTDSAVQMKISRLGLSERADRWTKKEIRILMEMRQMGIPLTIAMRRMPGNRTYNAIQLKRYKLEKARMEI